MNALDRWRARWRLWRGLNDHLNRRAGVEATLLEVAKGKRPLLTREECRQLALKLGSPS